MRVAIGAAALAAAMWCAATPGIAQPATNATAATTDAAPPVAAPTAPSAVPSAPQIVPAGTLIEVVLTQSISTHVLKRGDTFTLRLARPVMLGDKTVVPQGTPGFGEVIDAAPASALGKPAKLVLAARYLDYNGAHIPLKALRLVAAGADKVNTIVALSLVPYVGILAVFMHGGDVEIPAGTDALAKLAADLGPDGAPAPPPAPTTPTTTSPGNAQ